MKSVVGIRYGQSSAWQTSWKETPAHLACYLNTWIFPWQAYTSCPELGIPILILPPIIPLPIYHTGILYIRCRARTSMSITWYQLHYYDVKTAHSWGSFHPEGHHCCCPCWDQCSGFSWSPSSQTPVNSQQQFTSHSAMIKIVNKTHYVAPTNEKYTVHTFRQFCQDTLGDRRP